MSYPAPYLELRIQGKTGIRKCVAKDAVETFQRIVARRNLGADDFLFQSHHRDGFRELLEAAGLRGEKSNFRNLKSLRSTGLMFTITANPRINLKLLAENVGTSVTMLSEFYLKPLTVDMHVEELL